MSYITRNKPIHIVRTNKLICCTNQSLKYETFTKKKKMNELNEKQYWIVVNYRRP